VYELDLLISEEKINFALKSLTKHKFPLQPAITMDLIEELKMVTKKEKYKQLDNIFKE